MSFADHLNADRRLVILRLLSEQTGYKANSSVLAMRMNDLGHVMSRDQVKTILGWLKEQGLIGVDEPVPGLLVATLCERGLEVAKGQAIVPGVARPGA